MVTRGLLALGDGASVGGADAAVLDGAVVAGAESGGSSVVVQAAASAMVPSSGSSASARRVRAGGSGTDRLIITPCLCQEGAQRRADRNDHQAARGSTGPPELRCRHIDRAARLPRMTSVNAHCTTGLSGDVQVGVERRRRSVARPR
ncbi:hypothetical protein Misp05_20940 [Micromonospora sp. NBRC 107095]|nr:hypothetical protein Misp05_20940 [Micromonospora sp. NBRC 107095]